MDGYEEEHVPSDQWDHAAPRRPLRLLDLRGSAKQRGRALRNGEPDRNAFKFALFSFDLVTKGRPSVEHLVGLVIHLPFVAPIVHILLGIRLLFFDHTDAAQSARIEQIQKVDLL